MTVPSDTKYIRYIVALQFINYLSMSFVYYRCNYAFYRKNIWGNSKEHPTCLFTEWLMSTSYITYNNLILFGILSTYLCKRINILKSSDGLAFFIIFVICWHFSSNFNPTRTRDFHKECQTRSSFKIFFLIALLSISLAMYQD